MNLTSEDLQDAVTGFLSGRGDDGQQQNFLNRKFFVVSIFGLTNSLWVVDFHPTSSLVTAGHLLTGC